MPLLTPTGSRSGSPEPQKNALPAGEQLQQLLNGLSDEQRQALLGTAPAGTTAAGTTTAGTTAAVTTPAVDTPAGTTPAGTTAAVTTPAVDTPAGTTPAGTTAAVTPASNPSTAATLTRVELLFLETLEHTLPELFAMCRDDADLSRHIENGCKISKQNHPDASILHFLLCMEFAASKNEDREVMKQEQKKFLDNPKTFDEAEFGNDKVLMWSRAEKAFQTMEELESMLQGAGTYNSAERRLLRRDLRATPEDPQADLCLITDPETKQQVKAEIIGRHPHRRKWLVCALPSLNKQFPFVQRTTSIDGSSSEYRDILEKYALHGSDHTIPVGGKEDLQGCSPEDFEQNAVILLPWGKGFRLASYGYPHNKQREFKLFPKTVITTKWGTTTGLEIMHGHLQKCGTPIPRGKDGEDLDRVKARTWGM